jgi:hypothetical protein
VNTTTALQIKSIQQQDKQQSTSTKTTMGTAPNKKQSKNSTNHPIEQNQKMVIN